MVAINQNQITLSHNTLVKEYSTKADESILSMISLKAPEIQDEDDSQRPPVDLICCIDISGSMHGQKLNLCKKTMLFMVDELGPNDRFGIVSFSDEARVEFSLRKLSNSSAKTAAKNSINKLATEGCTNLAGGITHSIDELNRCESPNEVRAVLCLSDGLPNRGVTNPDAMLKLIQNTNEGKTYNKRKSATNNKSSGFFGSFFGGSSSSSSSSSSAATDKKVTVSPCSVHTFGFGSDHDSNLMKKISDQSHGTYFYIENSDQIAEAFINCVGGLTSCVASNICLTVESLSNCEISKVWSGYTFKTVEDKKKYEITMHDLQSEEGRDVLFELKAPKCDENEDFPVIKAVLTYKNLIAKDGATSTTQIIGYTSRKDSPATEQSENEDVGENLARLKTAEAMKAASEFGKSGNVKEAKKVLSDWRNQMEQVSYASKCDYLMDNLEAMDEDLCSASNYQKQGAHRFNNMVTGIVQQRSAGGMKMKSNARYATKKRKSMLSRFA